MRDGILHQGMPKAHGQGETLPDWIFHHEKSDFAFKVQEFQQIHHHLVR
jgi:hypothetical protein